MCWLVAITPFATPSADDFLQYDGWQNAKLHPAVFVDIKYIDKRPLVQVVMMSTSFKIQNVPPHLRGSVDDYFPGANTFNGTLKFF